MSSLSPPTSSAHRALFTFKTMIGTDITSEVLKDCASLFNENYGVWGPKGPKPGQRVKLSCERLRKQCLSHPEKSILVVCYSRNTLLGHAFAAVWDCDKDKVGWITQLVVDRSVRRRYIATTLLQTLKADPFFNDTTIIGLASSHPASCIALAKYAGVDDFKLDFIANYAVKVLKSSHIDYVRKANPRGSLFDAEDTTGVISSVWTEFYVDHDEPLEALRTIRAGRHWSLGELLDGYEFLALLPVSGLKTRETS